MAWINVRKRSSVALGRHRQWGLCLQLVKTKLHYKHRFPCKPKGKKKKKETGEAEYIKFLVGSGCNFHLAHPEFFQLLLMWDWESLFHGQCYQELQVIVWERNYFLDHLLSISYSGCCSNTSNGKMNTFRTKSDWSQWRESYLNQGPQPQREEHITPPEIDKILYNLCPPVDQSISCIIINSYSNNICIDIVSAYFQILTWEKCKQDRWLMALWDWPY